MATAEQVLAAAANAEKAGDMAAAEKLRAYAKSIPTPVVHSLDSVLGAARRARAAGDIAAADKLDAYAKTLPQPKGAITPDNPEWSGVAPPPRADDPAYSQATPPRENVFGDTTANMVEGPYQAMKAFGGGLVGGPSPSRDFFANDPLTKGLPSPVLTGLGAVGDTAMAGLSTVGAGIAGLTGLAAEAVPGLSRQSEGKLAGDLLDMSMFAVPELAGGSSVISRAAKAPRITPPVAQAAPTAKVAAEAATEAADIGALVRQASGGGMSAIKAQEKLAAAAKINPEAKAAADRLGIDLPPDVFSDSDMVQSSAGLTRSEVGTENEAAWFSAVRAAKEKADAAMAAMDGSPDLAGVSEAVKGSLQSTQASLKAQAKSLYDAVDAVVPAATPVPAQSIVKLVGDMAREVGGVNGLGEKARKVFAELTDPATRMTYRRLSNIKSEIQRAKRLGDGPYGDMNMRDLGRLENALVEDQLAAVETIGNAGLRQQLRQANQITAKQKALEKRIVHSFGSDLDGSIGQKLKTAVNQGAKGDIAGLNRILKVVPEDLRKQAVATAISAVTRSARATEPGFGFAEFAKFAGNLKSNRPVYNLVSRSLGPDAMKLIDDLHIVSQRIVGADSKVLRTGKANQALVRAITADGLVSRVLHSTAGQRATQMTAGAMGAATFGPAGAAMAAPIAAALTAGKADVISAAGKMFRSESFQALAESAAQGVATAEQIKAVTSNGAFKRWAGLAKIANPVEWLKDAPGTALPIASDAANSTQQPDFDSLYGRY